MKDMACFSSEVGTEYSDVTEMSFIFYRAKTTENLTEIRLKSSDPNTAVAK
jgi:hypothetical protein